MLLIGPYNMKKVKISNHPLYSDIQREVETNGIIISFTDVVVGQRIFLNTTTRYYAADDSPFLLASPKNVILIADSSEWVDANGNQVSSDSPDAVMTEYDYYMSLLTQPVVIEDIVEQKILWADNQGRFN